MMKTAKAKEPTETTACCAVCRYYQAYPYTDLEADLDDEEDEDEEEEELTGVCRRYPPIVIVGIPVTFIHPDVSGKRGWCGEFMPS